MKTEDLKALGIEDDELIKSIFALHGKSVNNLKSDLETAQNEALGFKTQLEDATKTLEGFKELDVEGIKAAASEWEEKAKQSQIEADKKVKSLKFDHAIYEALREAKAKNPKAVRGLLDFETLSLGESDEIEGIKEQLEAIREKDSYLFDSDEEEEFTPRVIVGAKSRKVNSDSVVKSARQSAGLEPVYDD